MPAAVSDPLQRLRRDLAGVERRFFTPDGQFDLFYLTSGLKSQILGEDQILTQVKDALSMSRDEFTTDSVLEVLFRMAVTAGKKIKTEVPFSHGNPSVIHQAIRFLEEGGYHVRNKVCMVIGNGEMGKMAAQTLREAGADVTVTIRQYISFISFWASVRLLAWPEVAFRMIEDRIKETAPAMITPSRTVRMESRGAIAM